jgi:hypothetical protein
LCLKGVRQWSDKILLVLARVANKYVPFRSIHRARVRRAGTKRDPNRIDVCSEGHIVTFPRVQSIYTESEGKPLADFERRIKILDENGGAVEIDEDMLLEAMQDFTQFLPRE